MKGSAALITEDLCTGYGLFEPSCTRGAINLFLNAPLKNW
jgi:hypothetical protein